MTATSNEISEAARLARHVHDAAETLRKAAAKITEYAGFIDEVTGRDAAESYGDIAAAAVEVISEVASEAGLSGIILAARNADAYRYHTEQREAAQ